jgi:hypothetical protein
MGRSRLSAAVYEKAGIVIDPDDPAFAVVELNRDGPRPGKRGQHWVSQSAGKAGRPPAGFPRSL